MTMSVDSETEALGLGTRTPKTLSKRMRWVRARALRALDRTRRAVASWGRAERGSDAPELLMLHPRYVPAKHEFYVDLIEDALFRGDGQATNIALTGGYGVGKSSILGEVARRHANNVLTVSLSTLGFPDDAPTLSGDTARAASTKTNRIQKEVVKQLLYSVHPSRVPGSGYRRSTRLPRLRVLGQAAMLGVTLALVFLLTEWGTRAAALLGWTAAEPLWTTLITATLGTAAACPVVAAFHHRLQVNALGAGGATIALSAKSTSYFDEYLDELVYFFEVVDRDIVIFEDVDRFDDAHIFETLRALNSLLNSAKQLRGRRVRFIYAIKDSIFEEIGSGPTDVQDDAPVSTSAEHREPPEAKPAEQRSAQRESEVARANRTKFFDVVIPVVPFVTHRSARDLLAGTLERAKADVSRELIDLAAKHVADMRLINNIRNEFLVFKSHVLDGSALELDQDRLLAMMLYKSTHLHDFERIKLGDSALDRLYAASRELIERTLDDIEKQLREARRAHRAASFPATRAKEAGDALEEYVLRVIRHYPAQVRFTISGWSLDGASLTSQQLRTPQFWEDLATTSGALQVRGATSYGTWVSEFTHEDIALALDIRIAPTDVLAEERRRYQRRITQLELSRDRLRTADMADLARLTEYKLASERGSVAFAKYIEETLGSQLARELVSSGFIDRNFTLYTSPFYGRQVSAAAANFMMKAVDKGIATPRFKLTVADVEAILRERDEAFLDGAAASNVYVFDYLLAARPAGATQIAKRLLETPDDAEDFFLAYLEEGENLDAFAALITPMWEGAIQFLACSAELEPHRRLQLLDVALSNLTDSPSSYLLSPDATVQLSDAYRSLPVYASDETPPTLADRAIELLASSGIAVHDLEALGTAATAAAVEHRVYTINRSNLEVVGGRPGEVRSLDELAALGEHVYAHVLESLPAYLEALGPDEVTVRQPSALARVVADVHREYPALLGDVLERAADECVLSDVEEVVPDAWGVLAQQRRFVPSFSNLAAYLSWAGGADAHLTHFLEGTAALLEVGDVEQTARVAMAMQVLRVSGVAPERRAQLVESLQLNEYLDVEDLPIDSDALCARLLEHDVIEDSADTYEALASMSWVVREEYIAASAQFVSYLAPTLVEPDLSDLLASARVPAPVKAAIVEGADDFITVVNRVGLVALVEHVQQRRLNLNLNSVKRLAQMRLPDSTVLAFLRPHIGNASLAELSPILQFMGGEYAKLAGATGKRPKLDRSADVDGLVKKLDSLGVVATIQWDAVTVRVNMRRSN